MAKPKNLKDKIIKLREKKLTYLQIAKKLGCTTSIVGYHVGYEQKVRYLIRKRKYEKVRHPYAKKLESYKNEKQKETNRFIYSTTKRRLYYKLKGFFKKGGITMDVASFNVEDIIKKFGEKPKCYITGDDIDISRTGEYSFDHKIPSSRGGPSTLDNLGICTKEANQAKSNMTPDEFFTFCKRIIDYQQSLSNS
jgi:5-methylcytosine-specific restriction endonuclease McrA